MIGDRETMWMERRGLVSRWEQSGESMAAFCRREGIAYWKLLSWRKRLEELDASEGGFAELVVGGEQCASEDGKLTQAVHGALLEIALPGGACVRVFAGADAALLRTVIEAARAC
jgi:hypothetical protein